MGVLGSGLYSDDLAADVRDDFRAHVAGGKSGEDATRALLAEWQEELGDPDTAPVFWLALADTAWRAGRLEAHVLAEARRVIEAGEELDRWRRLGATEREVEARRRVLVKLRQQLDEPQPAPKKVRPSRGFVDFTEWERGDVISFSRSDGRPALLLVLGTVEYGGAIHPVLGLLDWEGEAQPSRDVLQTLAPKPTLEAGAPTMKELLRSDPPEWAAVKSFFIIVRFSKRSPPKDRVARIDRGIDPGPLPAKFGLVFRWADLEDNLDKYYGVARAGSARGE